MDSIPKIESNIADHPSISLLSVINNDIGFENTTKFLYEVCDDLGVDLGNKFDRRVLNFEVGWGGRYEPASEEIDALIKALTYELKELKILKKEIKTLKEIDSLHTNEIDN